MPEEERVLINNDDELDGKRRRDDYNIQRVAKYSILVLSLGATLVVTVVVLVAIIAEETWRDYAIRATFQALPGIAAVVLVVLGLKHVDK